MTRFFYHILFLMCIFNFFTIIVAEIQNGTAYNTLNGNDIPKKFLDNDLYTISDKYKGEKVEVKVFYETLCPDCTAFYKYQFIPTVQKLSQYLYISTFPYGNAQVVTVHLTIIDHGRTTFKCQHGPAECYGNMLHACTIDYLGNITAAVIFNGCMVDPDHDGGSDDAAADRCAQQLNLNSEPIKKCAKGSRGIELLKFYGEKSKEVHFKYVPYILINNCENNGTNFMKDVCDKFVVPPPECTNFYSM